MPEQKAATPHVYTAIAKVMELIAKQGISKDRKNDSQGYAFRGIDDVYNALAPILSESSLCILPYVKSREVLERQTRSGGALFYVTVAVDFALVSAIDGSSHTISVVGEAMDSGDKATNKAMSAAYKYACMQAFCIPTEGDNDADKHTHEVAPSTVTKNEIQVIEKLAEAAGVELDAVCSAYGIKSIDQLPMSKASEAINRLQKKAQTATAPKE
jgi:hypothetical protein